MRLLHVTAGAGEMYCGSCLRDNALAAELLARGHDVLLLPVYTPTRTDEPNVSDGRVFYGGISVYLEQHVPLFRRTPAFLDRLWDAPGVLRAAAGRGVSVDPHDLGALTVSTLRGEVGHQAKELRKLLGYLEGLPAFDLVVLPNSLLIGLAPALKRALGRPVACTLQGEDLFLDALPEPHRAEAKTLVRRHAAAVDGFVATSAYYADFMAGYLGLDRTKIHTVPLGVRLDGHRPVDGARSGPFAFGYLARVAPEKGLHLLAEAYRILRRERGLGKSRLAAAGYLAPGHKGYLEDIRSRLRDWGLEGEFRYHGVLDRAEKIAFLQGLDALSVPSPYAEPKGLYVLEALANGVPCVQPRHGAFPEVLACTGGGLLFEPNDPASLAEQLMVLARDREAARALGRKGVEGVRQHHSVARMADRALEVYASIINGVRS
ncbi:MAG TPA: glycosyltransferase family 4 protein [Vicinamibacteria bacterium]|nr:glycosyltransferase family 4 protein [Vicinamibacteria bacterium]